jgi:hypothetical protein
LQAIVSSRFCLPSYRRFYRAAPDNRRSFLLASAVTTAIAQTDGDTAGTGMIGVGNRGACLLEAAMAQPRARILALCGIKPDRLDKAATAAARDNPNACLGQASNPDPRKADVTVQVAYFC